MTEEEKRAQEAAEAAAAQETQQTPAEQLAAAQETARSVVSSDPLQGQKLTINGQEVDASEYIRNRLLQVGDEERKRQYELEQKKLERRRLGEEIGEFSAVIGDMIKASNGALVTPRDFKQTYESLDARQRQLFDREWARRDAMKIRDEDNARRAKERDEDRAWQLFLLQQRQKKEEEQAAANRAHQEKLARIRNSYYGSGHRKPDDEYFIDFGNGESKDYKNNSKEGKNVYAAICQYLLNNGFIPEDALMDKDGNVVPVKTQAQADLLVRMYLPSAMEDPAVKSAVYKMVFGRYKDFRDPLTRSIEERSASRQASAATPSWQLFQPHTGSLWQPTPATQQGGGKKTTSSGSLY